MHQTNIHDSRRKSRHSSSTITYQYCTKYSNEVLLLKRSDVEIWFTVSLYFTDTLLYLHSLPNTLDAGCAVGTCHFLLQIS